MELTETSDVNILISVLSCIKTMFLIGPHPGSTLRAPLTFPLVHIIYHRVYNFFYHFKVSDCRRKLYTLIVTNQPMSKFRVMLTNVEWMKASISKLMLTHLKFLVNKLLLYIHILSWRHSAIYFNQLSLLYCFSCLTSGFDL